MKHTYILSVDQSTQSTKAMLIDETGHFFMKRDVQHKQIINDKGWVSHDPEEIDRNLKVVLKMLLNDSGIDTKQIAAVAVTNQRESAMVWDRKTGKPICNSVVWQCNRATDLTARIERDGNAELVHQHTGQQLSPFFSGAKLGWILENVDGAKEKAARGELCFGTMDSWVIWNLTEGKVHKTDYANATRMQLYNIFDMHWDDDVCRLFGLPKQCLPEVCDSDSVFGYTDLFGLLDKPVPIHADIGDSNASFFSNGCYEKGTSTVSSGTGSCVMYNLGDKPVLSQSGVTTCIAWKTKDELRYMFDGVINYSGAVIAWLQKNANLVEHAADTEKLAFAANPQDHTYLVPAFTGIGCPHWRNDASAAFVGMSRLTGRAEMVRAALESIAFQYSDIARAMIKDSGTGISQVYATGGPSMNAYLSQFQSDLFGCPVITPFAEERSGIGTAYMAGLAMGLFDRNVLAKAMEAKTYTPKMSAEERKLRINGWETALQAVFHYADMQK